MRKLLLILLMTVVGISVSMAQSVRIGAAGSKKAASAKPMMHQSLVTQQAKKEVKTKIAPYVPFAFNRDAKVVSSVSRGDKKIQLVKNANGTFSKKVVQNKPVRKLNRKSTVSSNKSTAGNTLFESFEGWDGETPGWTPDGWSRDNKTELETWYVSEGLIIYPTDGKYAAWVDWLLPFDDDFNPITVDPRDEMLISTAFTPAAGDYVIFDAFYSTYFMFFDMLTYELDFNNPVFNIQVLASTDDGENWDIIWDASKAENYSEYDEKDLENFQWYAQLVSLSAYIGQSIKIAFRYTDRDGGDNIGLDNIAVRGLNPTALYMRPQGYFKVGMTPEWGYYESDLMFGHAYEPAVWRNFSIETEANSWSFENPDRSGTMLTSTEKNLNVLYPYWWFEIPTLTATGGEKSSTYQWGIYEDKYLIAGGNTDISGDGTIVGVGNYDLSYDFWTYPTDLGYAFGTTSDNSIEGVANYFEKPAHKYILSGVWAAVYPFTCPANTEFTMIIHRMNDAGRPTDTIATSTCIAADVVDYMMSFTGFMTLDPETGLEIERDYVEIEDAILIEIKGFNNVPGAEIAFKNQEFNMDPTGENNAYFFTPDHELYYYRGSTSLIFSLDVTYSWLFADSDTFNAPEGGGEKTFDVTSYYSPEEGWWLEEDLPEWLSDDFNFNDKTWEIQYTLKAKPLPANTSYREAVVKVVTFGADMSILVKQEKTVGVPVATVADTKVVNRNGNFELTYTPGYSAVSVYNVAGQKIADYRLPDTGTFTVPAGNYPKGVYLISFTGAKGASTVKVMK